MNKYLYWTPRILTILFIIFMAIFSFDVFGEFQGWELLIAFLIHNIPTLVLIGVLIVAWKWENIGGIIFIILGIAFTIFFKTYQDIIVFFLISGPVFLIGILFLVSRYKK